MKKEVYPKLPKRFKKKWIAALRSGEYEQGRKSLFGNNKYCCLGVACIVAGFSKEYIHLWGYPPVDDRVPSMLIEGADVANCLVNLNDKKRYSFKRIANWIEKNL